MKPKNDSRYQRQFRLGILLYAGVFALCLMIGYGWAALIFLIAGHPSAIWSHILPELLGICVFISGMTLLNGWRFRGNRTLENARGMLMSETIAAMERIARGDFAVLLPVDERTPFAELAESVNKMAQQLGTMENLRQDFISNVSHELQSPLTSISGFAALLRSEALTPEQRMHYLDVIETEAKRLSKLSENLLRLSSLENSTQPFNVTTFSLDRQIQHVILMLEPQWTEKNLDVSPSLEKLAFTGDEELLAQVWINLIQNAIKFTPPGGKLDVTLSGSPDEIVCRVADNGVGFSETERIHIFERFYKADKSRNRALGGSGLGLSIVKKVVELHGGAVTAQSRPGVGSAFIVTLPLKIN